MAENRTESEKNRVKKLLAMFSESELDKHRWERVHDDIGQFVSTSRHVQYGVEMSPPQRKINVYDTTAPEAAKQLVATLFGTLMNPAQVWMALQPIGSVVDDRESLMWIQETTALLMSLFRSPSSGFYSAGQEILSDMVSFGTGCQEVIDSSSGDSDVVYRTKPLGEIYPIENDMGRIDTMFRRFELTASQAIDMWGKDAVAEDVGSMMGDKKFYTEKKEYIHLVAPRQHRITGRIDSINKKFESVYIDRKACMIVSESGFDEFPYMVARFSKTPGEVYGDSPANSIIEEIKMASAMRRANIKAGEKAGDPPLQLADNSVLGPVRSRPGGLVYTRPGSPPITALPTGDPRIGREQLQETRAFIQTAFFLDKLNLPLQDRMTATEVIERRRDALQVMAPFVSRMQEEYLAPMITRTLAILFRKGRLSPVPQALVDAGVDVEYISPLAISQRAGELQSVQTWLGLIQPMAQIDPTILEAIDTDKLAAGTSRSLNVPQQYVKPIEEVLEARAAAEQQQQMAQLAQTGGDAASAAKTAAETQQILQSEGGLIA